MSEALYKVSALKRVEINLRRLDDPSGPGIYGEPERGDMDVLEHLRESALALSLSPSDGPVTDVTEILLVAAVGGRSSDPTVLRGCDIRLPEKVGEVEHVGDLVLIEKTL